MGKQYGFVALLDVLGFTSLISGENASDRLDTYQSLLSRALEEKPGSAQVEAVIFSDSIVLTTTDSTDDTFIALALRCSELMGSMLEARMPLRGAISVGSYHRTVMGNSVFVAGKPIVDAYTYERRQDWVGIMITPSALEKLDGLDDKRLELSQGVENDEIRNEFFPRIQWAATVQPARITFKADERGPRAYYNGYAIVPRTGGLTPHEIHYGMNACLSALLKLRAVAPDPAAQAKFFETHTWLQAIVGQWAGIAGRDAQYAASKAKALAEGVELDQA